MSFSLNLQILLEIMYNDMSLRPDFSSKLVRELAFGTPLSPYDKINHGLVYMSSNCDVKSGLRPDFTSQLELRLTSLCFILSKGAM